MSAMALQPLSARELARTPTLFASFMGKVGVRYKTVAELLAIYRERSGALLSDKEVGDHMRVDRFMADMAGDRWRDDVVVRIGVFDEAVLIIDGIHRAIAYLACSETISADRLPALQVSC
jgi:hypothetical protein